MCRGALSPEISISYCSASCTDDTYLQETILLQRLTELLRLQNGYWHVSGLVEHDTGAQCLVRALNLFSLLQCFQNNVRTLHTCVLCRVERLANVVLLHWAALSNFVL